jgi:hypothetical protein
MIEKERRSLFQIYLYSIFTYGVKTNRWGPRKCYGMTKSPEGEFNGMKNELRVG